MTASLVAFATVAAVAMIVMTWTLLWPLVTLPAPAQPTGGKPRRPRLALLGWTMALMIPLLATSLYLRLGAPRLLQAEPAPPPHRLNAVDMSAAVDQLAQRLREQPDDLEGWFMLARSYQTMERWTDAASAYRQAVRLAPGDPQLLSDLADVLATAQGGNLEGEPRQLLERALTTQPDHPKSAALLAMADFRQGRLEAATARWEMLTRTQPPGSPLHTGARQGLDRVRTALSSRTSP